MTAYDNDFDKLNPGVYPKFVELAEDIKRRGLRRYSARAIVARIRWWSEIEMGEGPWKINDHSAEYMARRLVHERFQEFDGFFEFRKSRFDPDDRRAA